MALDNEVVNSAIDRAMDKIEAAANESEPTEKEVNDTGAGEKTEVTTEAATAKDPNEEAAEAKIASDKTRERDQSGKFTKGQGKTTASEKKPPVAKQISSVQEASTETPAEGEPQAEEAQEQTTVEAPAFWTPEEKAAFAKADPALRSIIATKEAQRNQWANRVATETERARTMEKQLMELYQPHAAKLQTNGINSVVEASSRLLGWNECLEKDFENTINQLCLRNGRPPVFGVSNDASQGQQYQVDPRIEQLQAQLEETQKRFDQDRQRQEEERLFASVNAFKNGKDARGQVRKQFAELYAPQITDATQKIQEQRPDLSFDQAMHYAYEFVYSAVAKVHGVQTQSAQIPQKTAQQKAAQAQKAKGFASSVTGAPRSGVTAPRPKLKGDNFNEKLESAMDLAEERAGAH